MAVTVLVAFPFTSVVAAAPLVKVTLGMPVPVVTEKVTVAPLTTLLPESFTTATSGKAKAVVMPADCGEPLKTAIEAGGPVRLFSWKVAGDGNGDDDKFAATRYGAALTVPLDFTDTVAFPLASVFTGFAVVKVTLAPLVGATNVTGTPESTLPPESFTVATSGRAKAVFTATLWGEPLAVVMVAGAPTLFVKENVVLAAPEVAVTT